MPTDPLLEVVGLRAGYGQTPILQGIDLSVRRGEIVSVIGRNGVGKTTFLRCLMGQLPVTAGRIRFDGEDITRWSPDARARRGIGFVPQGREVFPRLTVDENLQVGRRSSGDGRRIGERVLDYFPRLRERLKQTAGTMSGGEQQQLAIARALIGNPALLLLDEPSEGIQPSIVQLICDTLKTVRDELGSTIVFVEQNLDTILSLSERAYVIEKGRVLRHLDAAEVANADRVRESLLL
jgi:urea transport system ATP-binding protein